MQKETIAQNEAISTYLVKLEAELQSRTMEMSNMKAKRTEDQFKIDQEKSHLQQQRDEVAKEKSKQVTETGQMLMTINNIYDKCAHNNVKIIYPSLSNYNIDKYDNIKNFNNSGKSGEKAAI